MNTIAVAATLVVAAYRGSSDVGHSGRGDAATVPAIRT